MTFVRKMAPSSLKTMMIEIYPRLGNKDSIIGIIDIMDL